MSRTPLKKSSVIVVTTNVTLTAPQFQKLAAVPPEIEWFENLDSVQTRRAYRNDINEFMQFAGIVRPEQFREVNRAHVLAWRKTLENRQLASSSLRRKLAALSSLYEYLCDRNAVLHNPVKGVKRPRVESQEGKTPALSDAQARALLKAPTGESLKALRDRAILSVLLFHGLRREELATLKVNDFYHFRKGVQHLRIHGKGGKLRYLATLPRTALLVDQYIEAAGHRTDARGALFRPMHNRLVGHNRHAITPESVYSEIVRKYLDRLGIKGENMGPHALRTTAATSALDNGADIARVQEWLGHANISTTRIYDRRQKPLAESPTFNVRY